MSTITPKSANPKVGFVSLGCPYDYKSKHQKNSRPA